MTIRHGYSRTVLLLGLWAFIDYHGDVWKEAA